MIAPDDQEFLAGRSIPPRRIVVRAALAHVHAVDDGIPKRSASSWNIASATDASSDNVARVARYASSGSSSIVLNVPFAQEIP